jgi:hypothetical protein
MRQIVASFVIGEISRADMLLTPNQANTRQRFLFRVFCSQVPIQFAPGGAVVSRLDSNYCAREQTNEQEHHNDDDCPAN